MGASPPPKETQSHASTNIMRVVPNSPLFVQRIIQKATVCERNTVESQSRKDTVGRVPSEAKSVDSPLMHPLKDCQPIRADLT